jgi:molybdopterin-guanine dinucleotide biosynthesis protein A
MTRGVVGVLLAGGQSRRMGGGDKSLKALGQRTILERVIERLAPQVDRLVLNANGDPQRFASTGLPIVPDSVQGFVGPLAGVLAGMDWAAANVPKAPWIVTVATDAPFLPRDLVDRLMEAKADLACAASRGQAHPVIGLWAVRLRDDLRRALTEEGIRKVDVWTARHGLKTVAFEADALDPFMNVNTPEDLSAAEKLIAAGKDE